MAEIWQAGKHIGGEMSHPYDKLSFTAIPIDGQILNRIEGRSYKSGISLPLEDLRYLRIPHRDYSQEIILGEMICNKAIAEDLLSIFRRLFESHYPIEKMRLVDCYGADDGLSMEDNNSSCFNHRSVPWGGSLSKHASGMAVDINPKYNPLVRIRNGAMIVSPGSSTRYADRNLAFEYKVTADDICCKSFIERGFRWGGSWRTSKDYQHFEK